MRKKGIKAYGYLKTAKRIPNFVIMENYSKQLDNFLKSLDSKPKLLLLSCCAPCSSYVLEYLAPFFDIEVLFYNPNIYPEEEYLKRLAEQRKLCDILKIKLSSGEYNNEKFRKETEGLEKEKEGGARCEKCFRLRLNYAHDYAARHSIPYFAATLTVSPHKNAELINKIGKETESANVKYIPSDFKKKNGYLRSIELSEKYGLYRQSYCGCLNGL